MRTRYLHLLLLALCLGAALLFSAAPRADSSLEPFDGVWNATIGPAQFGDKCQVAETRVTRVQVPSATSIVWVYWTYRNVVSPDGRLLTGSRPLDFEGFLVSGAPRPVVDEANSRGLQGELRIELAADGQSFEGFETSYCIAWDGKRLTAVTPWAIPVTGRKVPVTLRVLNQAGEELAEVVQGEAFFVELAAAEAIAAPSGSWSLWYRSDVEGNFDIPAAGPGLRFRSGELTVNPLAADATLDFFAEARAGRLYAAAGTSLRFEFRSIVAQAEVRVRAAEPQ